MSPHAGVSTQPHAHWARRAIFKFLAGAGRRRLGEAFRDIRRRSPACTNVYNRNRLVLWQSNGTAAADGGSAPFRRPPSRACKRPQRHRAELVRVALSGARGFHDGLSEALCQGIMRSRKA
jgi:hypothetical protein